MDKNDWTPERFEVLLRKALELSDEYAWVYTDKLPRWWAEHEGKPVDIPAEYDVATRRARKEAAVRLRCVT